VAYVYVSLPTANQLYAFSAAADGTLTAQTGSPYSETDIQAVTTNGSYLFGVNEGASSILSWSIGSNGALTQTSSVNDSNGPASAFMDAAGKTFYSEVLGVANYTYDAFSVGTNGALTAQGSANGSLTDDAQLSFTSDDSYAYGAGCYHGNPIIYAYTRGSNGVLTAFNADDTQPMAPSGYQYCTLGTAVSGNYLIAPLELSTSNGLQDAGSGQLAVYTIGSNGTLTTSSTSSNMPTPNVGSINYQVEFDPTGTYLAVPGTTGIAFYSFSKGTLTLAGNEPLPNGAHQIAWDKSGNLYAVDWKSGNVYVFHLTNGVPAPASGSPFKTAASTSGANGSGNISIAVAPLSQ
jgi:6-phosphogluconolactonase (cycloisomerase 2 family)